MKLLGSCLIVGIVVLVLALAVHRLLKPPPLMTCLMVTGKDDERVTKWAPAVVRNFLDQTYPNKRLVILNHHASWQVMMSADLAPSVWELRVERLPHQTLGDLRNMLVDLAVPLGGWYCTFDDDDHRAPCYLRYLMSHANNHHKAVLLQNRLEHDLTSNYTWKARWKHGMPAFWLAKRHPLVKYDSRNTLEDRHMPALLQKHCNAVVVNNPAKLYIRRTHGSNTSPYVLKGRKGVISYTGEYTESESSASEVEAATRALSSSRLEM
eukprot:jgi/Chrzof1/8017/UNPLg00068.t1